MPKVITDTQTRDICRMISSWESGHKLDWINICIGAKEILGWSTPPTRQALNKKTTIKLAYQTKKESIRRNQERITNLPKPKSINDAANRIGRLEKEIEELKILNSKFADVIRRITYNASLQGLTKEQLMKPLPSVKEPKQ
ncbi:hypothetical protein [Pseudomonas brassicacearum]|uniref:Uncharacterized protein n=1 Tax=Pseudomonas brassicacearum TaxID=930166 RepID=A0A423JX74_9PSED|nr:hypothetical protein [Pseudomonas brassicacearum]RON42278.1 hypothetical protein BK664_01425 [Pseudomonas brassicacearum]